MIEYPSIQRNIIPSIPIYAFDKLDGSLIRAEWSRKNGFYKYGRKQGLLDHAYPLLNKARDLITAKYAANMTAIHRKQRWNQVVCFFEFFGPNSFAGQHAEDDEHDVVLFDVSLPKTGLLDPRDFIKIFSSVQTPAVLYQGKANATFQDEVKTGRLEGMTFEGVVCKGIDRKQSMFKIKSDQWIDKLRTFCNNDARKFAELL